LGLDSESLLILQYSTSYTLGLGVDLLASASRLTLAAAWPRSQTFGNDLGGVEGLGRGQNVKAEDKL